MLNSIFRKVSKRDVPLPQTCDFESEDICGFTQDLNHDFEWTRHKLKTQSWHVGTGPAYDHTYGEGKEGYYMYAESSFNYPNDTARLISPVYPRPDPSDEEICIEFFYHMRGETMGQLRVYLREVSSRDEWNLDPKDSIVWLIGHQGMKWKKEVYIPNYIGDDFQVIFEAIRGSSYQSDIAIDDFSIVRNCSIYSTSTEDQSVTYPTEEVNVYDSCNGRCGNFSSIAACDCDNDCISKGRCCVDVFWYCDFWANKESSTLYTDSTIDVTFAQTEIDLFSGKNTFVVNKNFTSTYVMESSTKNTISEASDVNSKDNNRGDENPKKMDVIPSKQLPGKIPDETPNKIFVETTKVSTETLVPTPVKIPVKIPSKTPVKPPKKPQKVSPVKPAKKTTKKPLILKTTKLRTTTTKTTRSFLKKWEEYDKNNDVEEVPNSRYIDDEETLYNGYINTKIQVETNESDKASFSLQDEDYDERFGNTRTVIWIVSITCVVIICIGTVFGLKRYFKSRKSYGRGKKMCKGKSGFESTCDVHYLTCDENLDFRLANEVQEQCL